MRKVLISEDIPSYNKGEAALFYGILESLKCLSPLELTLFSLNPVEDKKTYGNSVSIIDCRHITPRAMVDGREGVKKTLDYTMFLAKNIVFLMLFKLLGRGVLRIMRGDIWKAYVDADLVLMAHDSFWTPLYHGPLLFLFRFLDTPTVVYAATIIAPSPYKSRLRGRIINKLNRSSLQSASLITLRENHSFSYLMSLGLDTDKLPIEVYPDLAFVLPSASEAAVSAIVKKEKFPENEDLVGMAISQRKLEFAFPEISSHEERRKKALDAIVKMVDFITEQLSAAVLFMPHSIGPTPKLDDRITAGMIWEKARRKGKIIIIRNEYTPKELKGLTSRMDMTIGSRLHFTIDAVSCGIPSMLITHKEDSRCHGIMGDMLGQKRYVYNIESIDEASLIAMVQQLWEERGTVRKDLASRLPEIREKTLLHGTRVREILESIEK